MNENDFKKRFGSNSPLPPYNWSDDDYASGWNITGDMPPTRQQFDALQRTNDDKAAYLLDKVYSSARLLRRSTHYNKGDSVYAEGLKAGLYLECTKAGMSGTNAIDFSSPKVGDTITDGGVQWQIRKGVTLPYELPEYMETLLDDKDAATARATLGAPSTTGSKASGTWGISVTGNAATATKLATARTIALSGDATGSATFDGSANITVPVTFTRTVGLTDLCPDGAAAHNCFYRGKDITADFTSGKMSTNIANGTFKDIFVGDHIDKELTVNGTSIGTVRWRVGECDYYYRSGDSPCNTHHVLMVPDDVLNVRTRMNASNDTTGGYCASEMYTTTLPLYVTAIQNAFGTDHVLAHNELLTKTISADAPSGAGAGWTGSASGWDWKTVTANLFNEVMVYGTTAFSSSGFDVGNSKTQVALFHLNQTATIAGYRGNYNDKKWYWLRSIASSSRFCDANGGGDADCTDAADRGDWCGIRPYFLLR